MNTWQINRASMRFMHFISRFTYLLIGIDWRNNCYFVVHSRTGKKYHLLSGVLCSILGSTMTVLGVLVAMVLPVGIIDSAPVLDRFVILESFRALVGSGAVAYFGYKLDMIFEKRPDLYDEDFEPNEEWLRNWIY